MRAERKSAERRVLLLALTARDARASADVLERAGVDHLLCDGLAALVAGIEQGAGAVVLPEEAVLAPGGEALGCVLSRQPAWSDLPIVVLARPGVESPAVARALSTLGNVSLLERPARVSTLLSLIESSLKARERQYQVRDLLAGEREARAEADAASAAKDQFLAVLSHELRTPLSPVLLSVSAMESDPTLPAELRAEVSMIRRNIDLETKLIDDLLDLSRITTGKLRLHKQPTGVHELLQHVFQVCDGELVAKRLHLRPGLTADRDRVVADTARLEQVFWNLLKNAIKFTPSGGEITVRSRNRDGWLIVEVSDTGIGIEGDVLPKVFEAFEQGDAKFAWQSGLGLGLAICKAIVDLHGGTISAASDGMGKGARFLVEIPTLPTDEDEELDVAKAPAAPIAQPRRRLLVVEDHDDSAETLARLLRCLGYEVTTSSSVSAALEAAASRSFDLVISDIGLPDADGYELMRRLSRLYGMPGIALSGYGMEDDIRRSFEAGFLDHLVKPVDIGRLRLIVERVVGSGTLGDDGGPV